MTASRVWTIPKEFFRFRAYNSLMLVLIDESGDSGFKLDKGSSRYFVLAAVIFDDNLQAEKTAIDLKLFRQSLGFNEDYEFHFNSCSPRIREGFLRIAKAGKFRTRILVIDKARIKSPLLRANKSSFYNYAIKLLLKDNQGKVRDASVKLDGHGDRVYKRAVGAYLRQELNSPRSRVISKLKFVDSKEDILIQLADMVVGAVHYSYNGKKEAQRYRVIIKSRLQNIWEFDSR